MGILSLTASAADTAVKLAWPFTDHAVFQQGIWLPVWGKAASNATIELKFNGQTVTAQAAASGDFMLRLQPENAGGPYTLSVSANGGKPVEISDIMVGEVWIAGGQSNMQYQLNSEWSIHKNEPENVRQTRTNCRQLNEYLDSITSKNTIRALRIPMRTTDCEESQIDAVWECIDAEHAGELSAVGAWFGRDIQETTGNIVGIITCSWGGTMAETWTSRGGLMSNPDTADMVNARNLFEVEEGDMPSQEQSRIDFLVKNNLGDPGNKGEGKGWASVGFDDATWKTMTIPGSWVQQKLMGNGALWVRRTFTIPDAWVGKNLCLDLGPIDKHDITYVNGVEVGRTGKGFEDQHWDTHRRYQIPAQLVTSSEVLIAIRAFSHYSDGSLHGSPDEYYLSLGDERLTLAGEWQAMPEVDFGYFNLLVPADMHQKFIRPSILFESMLRAVIPYGIRGAIWYQGESNATSVGNSKNYRRALATMIRDWRYYWQQGDFPFIQVQLANYGTPLAFSNTEAWSFLRESQQLVCNDLPNVYLASAIDLGDAVDIHPQNKKEVGRRLALVAKKVVYGQKDLVCFGPVLQKTLREGNALRLTFANAEGMSFKGGIARGFYIAGEDRNFVAADTVTINKNTLLVSAKSVPSPVAVRYAWSDNPDGNLYNGAGLPAGSFRNDNW